jgi:hypothetical protein
MSAQQISFVGQGPSDRVAAFQQNVGQQIINQTYGGAYQIGLAPGQTLLLPSGQWLTQPGPYSDVQYFDQPSQMWRNFNQYDSIPVPISSDGTNYRYANLTGCPVAAVVTTAGTTLGAAYPVTMFAPTGTWVGGVFTAGTPNFVSTASAGGSTWNAFIGGAINTTVAITAGGTLYTVAPKIVVVPPAAQGNQPFLPASVTCTISGGAINAVTVTNQGAGYVAPPTLLILNQPGDLTGSGAVLTPALTAAGQLVALTMATPGTVQTTVPTIAFSGSAVPATAAATLLMNFSIVNTAAGTPTAGSVYTNGYTLVATGGISTATPVYTNPAYEKGFVTPTQPNVFSASTTVVAMNNAATIFVNGGTGYQVAPLALTGVGLFTTIGYITGVPVGGNSDVCLLYPL